jgi:hypothetical protein
LLRSKERAMASKFLPKITLSVSDSLRLQRLASSAAAERPSDDGFSAGGNRPRGNRP